MYLLYITITLRMGLRHCLSPFSIHHTFTLYQVVLAPALLLSRTLSLLSITSNGKSCNYKEFCWDGPASSIVHRPSSIVRRSGWSPFHLSPKCRSTTAGRFVSHSRDKYLYHQYQKYKAHTLAGGPGRDRQ